MTQDQVDNVLAGSGAEGFFSYDMNIDLKKQTPGREYGLPSHAQDNQFQERPPRPS